MEKTKLHQKLTNKSRRRLLKLAIISGLSIIFLTWFIHVGFQLAINANKPLDAFLVLGGSIQREVRVAQLANQYQNIPILVSQGSEDPCIWLIFQHYQARLNNVWLEKCADSTFENYFFSIPILRKWQVHKVRLITSESHLPRAKWLGQILLGAQGIWVEFDIVKEKGIPGNYESPLKTALDITRSLLWVFPSQIIKPSCHNITPLTKVNLDHWRKVGFECEYLPGINLSLNWQK